MLFIDHLSRLKRDMILKKLAKWRKEQTEGQPDGVAAPYHAHIYYSADESACR